MTAQLTDLKAFARSTNRAVTQLTAPRDLPVVVFDIVGQQHKVELYRAADLYVTSIENVWPSHDRYLTDGNVLIQGGLTYNDYSLQLRDVDSGGIGIGAEYFRGARPINELLRASPRPDVFYPKGVWIHGGSGPAFFGHWLWEFVTKFVVLKMLGRIEETNCILSTALPNRFLGWLYFLFSDRLNLTFVDPIAEPGFWQEVEIISTPIYRSRFDNKLCVAVDVLRQLRQLGLERAQVVGSALQSNSGKPRALWIDRNSPWRNLINTAEIIGVLQRLYDVEHISMEKLSPSEQIRVIQAYDLILGPSGSSMPISIFANPKSVVLEFFNPRNEGRLAAKLFCDFFGIPHVRVSGEIVGEQNGPTHTDFDYRVDSHQFYEILKVVLSYQLRERDLVARHDFGPAT